MSSILNGFMFLDTNQIDLNDSCVGVSNIVGIAKVAIKLIQIIVPIALIIWGSIDMLKAIVAGDEKKIAGARKPLMQRFISAIIVFLIPFLFNTIMGLIAQQSDAGNWIKCYNDASWSGTNLNISIDQLN